MAATTGAEDQIPFVELSRAATALRQELDAALANVIESGRFILGEQCAAFERELARALSVEHAVGVASGTDALELALRALGVGPGTEVVTQANTCVPTIAAVLRAGARPVLCDVEPEAGTMDPSSLEAAVGARTRAIIPVHLYGQCGDMDAIMAIASSYRVPVVEDCAQASGAGFRDRRAGSIGTAGCFSFYPTKNLGALGDAGALTTDDPELAAQLQRVRQYGQSDGARYATDGVNSRMDEIQASILRVKLPRLKKWNARRAEIAAMYTEALRDTPLEPLRVFDHGEHVFHLFVVKAFDREGFAARMRARGVTTLVHYPKPLHGHPPYRDLVRRPVDLSISERLAEIVISLPLHPELTDDEAERIATAATESAKA